MHAGDQDGFDDGGPFSRVGVKRGAILVGAAVLIGGFLVYRNGSGGSGNVDAAAGPGTTLSAEGQVDDTTNGLASPSGGPGSATSALAAAPGVSTTVVIGAPGGTPAVSAPPASALTAPETSATTATTAKAATTGPATIKAPAAQASGPAAISVLVLNAGAVKGAAGKEAQALTNAGYTVLAPRNADTLRPSAVLYIAGHDADARAVAQTLKVKNTAIIRALNPADPPVSGLGDAEVIVVLGSDGQIAGG